MRVKIRCSSWTFKFMWRDIRPSEVSCLSNLFFYGSSGIRKCTSVYPIYVKVKFFIDETKSLRVNSFWMWLYFTCKKKILMHCPKGELECKEGRCINLNPVLKTNLLTSFITPLKKLRPVFTNQSLRHSLVKDSKPAEQLP